MDPSRTISPVITGYPWLSDIISHRSDLRTVVNPNNTFYRFMNNLHEYETNTLLNAENKPAAYERHLLRISYEPTGLVSTNAPRYKDYYLHLVPLLCAYRFADVLGFLDEQNFKKPAPISRTAKAGKANYLHKYNKLDDWTTVLKDFLAAQKKAKPRPLSIGTVNRHIELSKWVVHESSTGRLSAIASNFFAAAMQIAYLTSQDVEDDHLPLLCTSLESLTNVNILDLPLATQELAGTSFSTDEIKFWTDIFDSKAGGSDDSTGSNGRVLQPLQLALLISPLFLFLPIKLLTKPYGKDNIIHTSIALGNEKPAILQTVERIIWRALCDTATGVQAPETALAAVAERVPWTEIATCSSGDRRWFQLELSGTPKDRHSNQTTSFLTTPSAPSSIAQSSQSPTRSTSPDMHEPSFTALDLEDSQIAAPLSRIDSTPVISTSLHSSKVSPSVPFVSPSEIIMAIVGAGSHSSSISTNVLPFPLRHGDYEMQDLTGDIHVAASDEEPPAVEQEHKPSPFPVDEETTAPKSPNSKELKVTEARPGKRDIAEGMVEDNPEDEGDEDEDDEDESGLHGDQTESKGKERATDQAEESGDEEEIDHDGESDNIPSTFLSSTNKTRKPAATAQVSQPSVNDIDNLHSENLNFESALDGSGRILRSASAKAGSSSLSATTSSAAPPRAAKRKRAPTVTDLQHARALKAEGRDNNHSRVKKIHLDPRAGSSKDYPIDVDQYSLFNFLEDKFEYLQSDLQPLGSSRNSQRVSTKNPLRLWDGHGRLHSIHPRFHHEPELVKFVQIMGAVANNYIDGLPKHVASPSDSCFQLIDFSDYREMTESRLLKILQTKCIVIRNMEWSDMRFDEAGLSTLSPMDAVISIQDLSLAPNKDGSVRIQNGTLGQMLLSSKSPNRSKALNALSFPFPNADAERSCFDKAPQATCRISWGNTLGTVFPREAAMPISDIHWGLAATEGANSLWHIDSDGLGTTVDVRVGEKLWIVGSDEDQKFMRLGLLLSTDFDLDSPPRSFKTEAILLTAKTRLIMRPNVVHAVFTPKNTICHGSHFYCSSTMQASLASLIHGFVCHHFITNISHPKTRAFHRRLIHFYHRGLVLQVPMTTAEKAHLPSMSLGQDLLVDVDEVLNFLSLCAMVVFANALDPRSYMAPGQAKDAELTTQQKLIMGLYDVNAIPQEEREEICTARGACFETLAWFRKTTRVVDATTRSDIDLPSVFFVRIARSLLRYKYAAEVNSIQAVGGCLLEPLQVQLEAALELDQQSHALWTSQAAGSWLDEELRDAKNVEVDDNARPQEAASALEEGEVEDLCMDAEEGEVSNVPDRRVDVKVARLPPVRTTSSSKWRSELLGLEDKQNLIITLTTHKFSPPKMGHTKWKTTGETSRDRAYTAAVHIRKASEAVGMKDHFMDIDDSSF